jgi:hypothetical protein
LNVTESSGGGAGQERRQQPRKKVEVKIEVHLEGSAAPIRTKVADLTLGGCFVEMMFTLDIGTKLNIGLWINDIKVSAEGIVVTRLRNLGNGIQFTKLAAEDPTNTPLRRSSGPNSRWLLRIGERLGRSPVRVSSQRNTNQISPFLCDYGVALTTFFS